MSNCRVSVSLRLITDEHDTKSDKQAMLEKHDVFFERVPCIEESIWFGEDLIEITSVTWHIDNKSVDVYCVYETDCVELFDELVQVLIGVGFAMRKESQ